MGALEKLEAYFHWHGALVARRPYAVICFCLVITAISCLGLLKFKEEREMVNLWVEPTSRFRQENSWVQENFPRELRIHQVMFKADNVLEPAVLREMARVRRAIMDLAVGGISWKDVCLRVPIISKPRCLDKVSLFDSFFGGRRRREAKDECEDFEPPDLSKYSWSELANIKYRMETEGFTPALAQHVSLLFYPQPYCQFVSNARTVCFEESILELWGRDGVLEDDALHDLTLEDVLRDVNTKNTSGVLMAERHLLGTLGEKKFNSSGWLHSAQFSTFTFIGQVNLTELELTGTVQMGHAVDKRTNLVEVELTRKLTKISSDLPEGVTSYNLVANMFFDSLENMVFKDARMLIVGYLIVFCYLCIMLGRCSLVEHRFYVSLGGMVGVVMGMAVSYSICSVIGFFYGPTHTVLPFLLLGIGIDNMFVIRQCLTTVEATADGKDKLEDIMSNVMGRAGVAITITSITGHHHLNRHLHRQLHRHLHHHLHHHYHHLHHRLCRVQHRRLHCSPNPSLLLHLRCCWHHRHLFLSGFFSNTSFFFCNQPVFFQEHLVLCNPGAGSSSHKK